MAYNNSVPSSSYQGGQNYQQLQTDPDIQSSYETIPAKTTAGLHQADSDLNNRTQYAPRTATASATNTDPGAMTASNSSSGGVVGGSSTGAPAVPSPATRSKYSREHSSYNPATGTEYTPRHPKEQTTAGTAETSGSTASASGSRGDGIGQSIKGTLAGIHGAGESIRGTFNAAVDRAFNEPEGAAKNEAIEREGEYEAQSGQFSSSTKQREGFRHSK